MNFTLLSSELQDFLIAQGIPASVIHLRDMEYVLPTERWATGTFGPWFSKKLVAIGFVYRPNSRDCDKFARFGAAWAGECNAVTEERAGNVPDEYGITPKPTYGSAFGETRLKLPGSKQFHSIDAIVHRPNRKLTLTGLEPQPSFGDGLALTKVSMRVIKLERKDWGTCNFFDM